MKMTKKIFMVAIATCAFALTGCMGMDGFGGVDGGKAKDSGTKKNLTIDVTANADSENGSKKYQRMWKQLGTKETVQAIETKIQIDTTNVSSFISLKEGEGEDALYVVDEAGGTQTNAVVGLIFDLHETKVPAQAAKTTKEYDFVLVGYRPSDDGFYIEQYTGITKDMFDAATNATGFGTVTKNGYITESQDGFVYNGSDWVKSYTGKLGKDDDGKEYKNEVSLKEFTVSVTQDEPGTYVINMGGKVFTFTPEYDESLVNKKGYRIGGAGYYVNAPLGTAVKANFNSKNDNTIGLEEEVEE